MVYPHNTFDAETAKAWVGEGRMKQYFKVIPKPKPPKPRGRPPKRKARSTNKPPTEFNSAAPVPAPAPVPWKYKEARLYQGFGEPDGK